MSVARQILNQIIAGVAAQITRDVSEGAVKVIRQQAQSLSQALVRFDQLRRQK